MCAALLLALPVGRAAADTFHLASGAIEGRLVEETATLLIIETESGRLQLPSSAVSRRGKGPTRLEKYQARRGQGPLTADQHVEVVRWCLENGLARQADEHLAEALALQPGHVEARALAGYIEVDGLWLLANAPARAKTLRGTSPARLAETLSAEWHRWVNVLAEAILTRTPDSAAAERSREQLLAIRSPQAIGPMCRALGGGDKEARRFLIDLLSGFEEDESVLNLCVLALLDPDVRLREHATTQLTHVRGPRVSEFFVMALGSDVERVVGNAAQVLGWLGDRTAVGPLIDALNPDDQVGGRVTSRQLFAELTRLFQTPTLVPIGAEPIEVAPVVHVIDVPGTVQQLTQEKRSNAGTVRSEVQDALILLTGQNYGFDAQGWREWLSRNPPLGGPLP
jgi:hypothetical protein